MIAAGNYCYDKFWDLDVIWHTEVPDFPDCFQQIVFQLIPHLLFCAFFAPYFLFQCRNKFVSSSPWTSLLILKLLLCFLLLAVSVSEIFYDIYFAQLIHRIVLYNGVIRILCFGFVVLILLQHKNHGVRFSTMLFLFWLVLSICGTVMFRSVLLKVFVKDFPVIAREKFILDVFYFTLIYCELFLSLFYDSSNYLSEKKSPLEKIPAIFLVSFFWITGLIIKSTRKLLSTHDFDPLSERLKSGKQFERFNAKWNPVIKKTASSELSISGSNIYVYPNLTWTLIKAFWPWIICALIFEIIADIMKLIPVLILDLIINYVTTDDYLWKGYFYCSLIFIVSVILRYFENASLYYTVLVSFQVKAALASAIYRKAIKISNSTRKNYTTGELVNLTAVDIDKIFDFLVFFPTAIAIPFKVMITIGLLWRYLGLACLAGVTALVVFLFISSIIAKISGSVQVKQMAMKDVRMKYMSEMLNGIKVLKFWAWEEAFMKRLYEIRRKEVHLIRKYQFCYAGSSFFFNCSPFVVSVVSFMTYLVMDSKNVLYPSTAFVSLNLLTTLKYVLYEFPNIMSRFIQAKVSMGRVNRYLIAEEMDRHLVGKVPDEGDVLTIKDASFSWNLNETIILKNINLHIKKGDLIAVIGLVGSGKSSLISSCLGSMYKLSGLINIQGSVAYVPQQAWIQNQTVCDNILFMKPMDRRLYNSVIECCSLKTDLEILPGYDMTEIGEKGVNLSGGQKQRISLARAVYQDADVYLLDDPLSAVDAHVGKHIFDNVIGKNGLLRHKTRILVTHDLSFLPEIDTIICMKDGQIEEIGTYEAIINNNRLFAEFIQRQGSMAEASQELTEDEMFDSALLIPDSSQVVSISRSINRLTSSACNLDEHVGKLIDDEKMEIGEVKKTLYLDYARHAGLFTMLFAMFCYFSYQAFEIGANIWLSEWSTDSLDPSYTNVTVQTALRNKRIGIYTLLGAGEAIATVLGVVLLAIAGARASRAYYGQMLESIMKSPMSFFDTTPQGRITNRFGKDIDVIDVSIPIDLDSWLYCFFTVCGTFVVVGMTTPTFLIGLGPLCIIYYFILKLYLKSSRQIKRMESIRRSPIFSFFAETIQGTPCIKAYNAEEIFTKKFESKVDENQLCFFYWSCCNRWLSFQLGILGSLILLLASVLAIYNKDVLGGALVGLSLTYAMSVTESLMWLIRSSVELENESVSVERIDEYSKLPSEAAWFVPNNTPSAKWPEKGLVQFDGYSTRYREDLDYVLKRINLVVFPGEKIGIVGRTGAGKSSITLALFRIMEAAEGRVLIDDIDISKIGLHSLRSKLTIIPQEPILFSGSLRFNLDPDNSYSDNDLWTSLGLSHMKLHFSTIPDGLEAEISEGGENLSVGQRQLLCLARALLKKTRILILDEATAAVDVETDYLIQETIRREFRDYTVITIAHRLNTIMDYDRVVVMDSGNIAEVGAVSELLSNPNSYFHDMAKKANLI